MLELITIDFETDDYKLLERLRTALVDRYKPGCYGYGKFKAGFDFKITAQDKKILFLKLKNIKQKYPIKIKVRPTEKYI